MHLPDTWQKKEGDFKLFYIMVNVFAFTLALKGLNVNLLPFPFMSSLFSDSVLNIYIKLFFCKIEVF